MPLMAINADECARASVCCLGFVQVRFEEALFGGSRGITGPRIPLLGTFRQSALLRLARFRGASCFSHMSEMPDHAAI